jgi:hypothetical protein
MRTKAMGVVPNIPEWMPKSPVSAFERHYSPHDLAEIWQLSADTVRRLFEREPGVLVVEHTKNNARRRYRTFRIPESVALRVHRRMTNAATVLTR